MESPLTSKLQIHFVKLIAFCLIVRPNAADPDDTLVPKIVEKLVVPTLAGRPFESQNRRLSAGC